MYNFINPSTSVEYVEDNIPNHLKTWSLFYTVKV